MKWKHPLKTLLITAFALTLFAAPSAKAQTLEELQRQLQAERAINEQLRQRIETLEETIESLQSASSGEAAQAPVASQIAPPSPADEMLEEGDLDALEQALVQQGSSVLPPGTAQIVPGASWSHSGSSAFGSESNFYVTGLAARYGMQNGFMASVSVPYVVHSENAFGSNSGLGDISVSLSKQLLARTRAQPSLIASIGYTAPTGEDPFEADVSTGAGFHSLSGTISAVKSADPVAFYGDLSYAYSFSRSVGGNELQPGGLFGLRLGSSLAATPEIALNLGMSFGFSAKNEVEGVSIAGSDRTIGTVDLGAGIILNRNTYLSIFGRAGVTEDAPDLTIGVALPIRF